MTDQHLAIHLNPDLRELLSHPYQASAMRDGLVEEIPLDATPYYCPLRAVVGTTIKLFEVRAIEGGAAREPLHPTAARSFLYSPLCKCCDTILCHANIFDIWGRRAVNGSDAWMKELPAQTFPS